MTLRSICMSALVLSLLVACSQAPTPPTPEQVAAAEAARPADPQVASIYQRSCVSCHTAPASTAPLVGLAAAWEPRLKQGMPVLVQHAREGYKAMPAKGLCSDCSDADLQKLIEFMSAPVPANKEKA